MKKILLAVCALALALGSAMPVSALTTTANMSVSLTVIPVASVSVTNMSFGSVTPGAAVSDTSATITVNVTSGSVYTVTVDAGTHYLVGDKYRNLQSGATSGGGYVLSKDSGFAAPWGDASYANTFDGYATGVASTGTGANQTLTIWGRFNGTAPSTAGTYTDTVTVTVNY
ncbi:MAG: spore coat protein U domain-containing protein [Deltaproteobacteria bacterium]|nr:spore coat protein U domain-containing protein [Deltaproteobacteria bacterium]